MGKQDCDWNRKVKERFMGNAFKGSISSIHISLTTGYLKQHRTKVTSAGYRGGGGGGGVPMSHVDYKKC